MRQPRLKSLLIVVVMTLAALVATPPAAAEETWPIYKATYSGVKYELVNNTTPTVLPDERWKTVYAAEVPLPTDTVYLKYSWAPTLYAVTRWPGGEPAWQWELMTYDHQRRAGFPAGTDVPWIAGTVAYRWDTGTEVFFLAPDSRKHKVTADEFAVAGSPSVVTRTNEGFVKLTWADEVFRMTSLSGWTGYKPAWNELKREDSPTAKGIPSIPGQTFTVIPGTNDIQYSSSLMTRKITYSQWRAAGFPLQPTSSGPLVSVAPGQFVNTGGFTYVSQSAAVEHAIRVGPNYARFEVHAGENRGSIDGDLERAEIARVGQFPRGTELWGAFDLKVTGDVSQTWPGGGPNVSQLFANPEPGESNKPPPLAFKVTQAGALEVHTRGDQTVTTVVTPRLVVRSSIPNANDGRVIRVVYRVIMNPFDGELDVWINGVRVVRTRGASIGYNDTTDESMLQFKIGQYRSHTDEVIVTEFANVEFGTKNLLARISTPPAWPVDY